MIILSSPVKVSQLFKNALERGSCSVLYSSQTSESALIGSISTLDDALANPPIGRKSVKENLRLVFASEISDQRAVQLAELANAVLVAPDTIRNNSALCQALEKNNTLVITTENPRLDFINALAQIEQDIVHFSESFAGESNERVSSEYIIAGKGCVIKPGAIVGHAGFGFERDENGTPVRFPHFGKVILGDNVEIGANTVISRGSIADTRIGDDTKIDDLVYIAHNCQIGSKVMIAGNATLCGGVKVGDRAWIGAGAMIRQNISIGEGAVIGMGTVVVKDIPAGATVMGNPAVEEVKKGRSRCAV